MNTIRQQIKPKSIFNSILNSYSQIFFSNNRIFAFILLFVSFFDVYVGLPGFMAVVISNMLAFFLGFNKERIKSGLYGFNSLLVGLGLGLYFQASPELLIIVFLMSILTLFLSLTAEGILTKYGLPYLSIPFILAMWMILLASRDFTALGISERGIYSLNEMYSLGGKDLVDFYIYLDSVEILYSLKIYFLSLGAIFFQYNVLAGILISIGLLIYSRIAFSLSLIGFFSALLFYELTGADITALSYSYIGFNFILTAIAVGGFFVIPSYSSYLWTTFLLPVVVIVTISFSYLFATYQLSIYSLPFNVVTLLFIYVLKLRMIPSKRIVNYFKQYNSPEKNLYNYKNDINRFKNAHIFPLALPFFGTWTVSQAHRGEYTHKGDWQHAWDFIIEDADGKQFKNNGDYVTDYYCYGKAVIAPAAGIVENITDDIPDNIIGEANMMQNWGNSIVIKHAEGLYSQISHIKAGSYKVTKGQYVNKGQVLAQCGSSGNSPYPHMHFQVQTTPFIGSKTLEYPISNFILETENGFEAKFYEIPKKNAKLSNVQTNILLTQNLKLTAGQTVRASISENTLNPRIKVRNEKWKIVSDVYKNTYIYCQANNSFAYFINDGSLFRFTNFTGSKNSILFYYYLSFQKIQLGYYDKTEIRDKLPINLMFDKFPLFLQDFIAPFYIWLSSEYKMKYLSLDDDLSPSKIEIQAEINNKVFSKIKSSAQIDINLKKDKNDTFKVISNHKHLIFEIDTKQKRQ